MHLSRKPLNSAEGGLTGRLYKYDVSLAPMSVPSFLSTLKMKLINDGFPVIGCTPITSYNHSSSSMIQSSFHHISEKNNPSSSLSFSADDHALLQSMYSYANIDVVNFGHIADQNLHLNILLTWKFTAVSFTVDLVEKYKQLLKVI